MLAILIKRVLASEMEATYEEFLSCTLIQMESLADCKAMSMSAIVGLFIPR